MTTQKGAPPGARPDGAEATERPGKAATSVLEDSTGELVTDRLDVIAVQVAELVEAVDRLAELAGRLVELSEARGRTEGWWHRG